MNIYTSILNRKVFLLLIAIAISSCKSNKEQATVKEIDLKTWHITTIDFINHKCDVNGKLKERLVPALESEGEIYRSLDKYIYDRLNFRKSIDKILSEQVDFTKIESIRVEEFYTMKATAIIYLRRQKSSSLRKITITDKQGIMTDEEIELGTYQKGEYSNDCTSGLKNNMITNVSIVTDISPGNNYQSRYASLF